MPHIDCKKDEYADSLDVLVRNVRRGSISETRLYNALYRVLIRRIPSWLGSIYTDLLQYMDIDDILQECMLCIVKRLKTFDPDKSDLRLWLRVVIDSHLRDLRKSYQTQKRHAHIRTLLDDEAIVFESPIDILLRREAIQLFAEEIGNYELMQLRYVDKISLVALENIFGIPKSSLHDRFKRAKKNTLKRLAA